MLGERIVGSHGVLVPDMVILWRERDIELAHPRDGFSQQAGRFCNLGATGAGHTRLLNILIIGALPAGIAPTIIIIDGL